MTTEVHPTAKDALSKAFNAHGYGFQCSAAAQIAKMPRRNGTAYLWDVEVPVRTLSGGTRIDIVAVMRPYFGQNDLVQVFVIECKRADPTLRRWSFANSTIHREYRRRTNHMIFDALDIDWESADRPDTISPALSDNYVQSASFITATIGLATKTDSQGEPSLGGGRDVIEEVCGQVLKGVSGMVNLIGQRPRLLGTPFRVVFIPVVLTTAELCFVETDLDSADFETGNLNPEDFAVRQIRYLFLQYPRSMDLAPDIDFRIDYRGASLQDLIEEQHSRTVAFVTPAGLINFLDDFPRLNRR